MTTPIGSNLRAIRGERGYSQEELAEKAEVKAKTISEIELGQVARPLAGTIYRLAKALGVTVLELTRDPEKTARAAPPSES